MISANIGHLRNRIRTACERSGRQEADVQVVAVAKTFPAGVIREAFEAGITDFGENYVQELEGKRKALERVPVRWHFVGHLQTNKVKDIASYIDLVHSVDNIRLAREIQKRGEQVSRVIRVLVEVHTTDEATKYGVQPSETLDLVREISALDHVGLEGLMTMGPFSEDPEDSRPSFRKLMQLKREIEAEKIRGVSMRHLSMGMTHDFEIAIEEGATIVRIGTAIFGERSKRGKPQADES